jgi:hypothetical protein
MKKMLLISCLFFTFSLLKAQDSIEPFFKAKRFESGFFVQADLRLTQIMHTNTGMITAFSGCWTVNRKYYLGAQYERATTGIDVHSLLERNPNVSVNLEYMTAGLKFGYILFPDKIVSFNPDLSLNWAQAKYAYPAANIYHWNFFMMEPSVNMSINPLPYFSVGAGLAYRLNLGLNLNGIHSSDLNGLNGLVFVRVGTMRR